MSPALVLRRAAPADLDAIMTVETACFPPGIVESRDVFERRLLAFPAGFFVAENQGAVVGYACGELWRDWSIDRPGQFDLGHDLGRWHRDDGTLLYVSSVALLPTFRGRGWGKELFVGFVAAMKAAYPALSQTVLIVNEHWAAHRLYQRQDFVEVGRLPGFFQPEGGPVGAAVVMVGR